MLKFILVLFFALFSTTVNAQKMSVLSAADEALYKQIFELQQKENWKEADKKIAKLKDKSLMGYVLSDRYFSKTWKTTPKEIENWFKEKNYKANITCSFAPISNAAALVQQNLGIAIVPESTKLSVSDKDIIIKELEEERTSGVCVIWRKDVELPGVAKSFLKLLSAYANSKK